MNKIKSFKEWVSLTEAVIMPPEIYGVEPDKYGETIGINDKDAKNYKIEDLNLPADKPIGDIAKSAWANLNVPTRGIPATEGGNLGCAAAVSIIFYRATGLPIIKGRDKNPIELGTSTLWSYFTGTDKDRWEIIRGWRTESKPGDIILTSRGRSAGHVGVVVEDNKIISNSSGGFAGDKKGQIELNYDISSWDSVAMKNPLQTAAFRYKGEILDGWGGNPITTPMGSNDEDATKKEEEIPTIVIKNDELLDMKILPSSEMVNLLNPKSTEDLHKLLMNYLPKEEPKKKKILGLFNLKNKSGG